MCSFVCIHKKGDVSRDIIYVGRYLCMNVHTTVHNVVSRAGSTLLHFFEAL